MADKNSPLILIINAMVNVNDECVRTYIETKASHGQLLHPTLLVLAKAREMLPEQRHIPFLLVHYKVWLIVQVILDLIGLYGPVPLGVVGGTMARGVFLVKGCYALKDGIELSQQIGLGEGWWWCRPAKYSLNLSIMLKS